MSNDVDVDIRIGFDLPDLERQLTDAQARVMQKHRERMVRTIRNEMWVGWKYANNPPEPGRSRRAWKGYEDTTAETLSIVIENKARSYYGNRAYAAYVKRRKGAEPEAAIVLENLLQSHLPALIDDMQSTIGDELNTASPPRRVRQNRSSTYKTMNLEG